MLHSTDRILTTHTGSLPRPAALTDCCYFRNVGNEWARTLVQKFCDR